MLLNMLANLLVALPFVSSYLYLIGNEFATLTGGWVATVWAYASLGFVQVAPVLTHAATYLQAEMTSLDTADPNSGAFGTDNAINLTGVTKIRVKLSAYLSAWSVTGGYQQLYLFVTNDDPPVQWGSTSDAIASVHLHSASTAESLTDVTYDLNVSLSGNYFVYVGLVWKRQSAVSWVRVTEVNRIY